MHKVLMLIAVSGILLMGSGCASIVSKSQWPVTINSSPGGATVTVKNKRGMEMQKGSTPMTVVLPSGAGFFSPASYQFSFEKEGYQTGSASLSAGLNGWYVGNLIFGWLIGFVIVDPATGAMWRLDDVVYGNLPPDTSASGKSQIKSSSQAPLPATENEDITEKLKKLKELKDSGILTEEEYEQKRKALVDEL